ncbi:MAG: hypothetical protein F6K09_14210 [Merismopedia sp. SIO2A8]|nr:hypothetical protein [Merismopedia sp. SIO2A8]
MNLIKVQSCLLLAGSIWSVVMQPVMAEIGDPSGDVSTRDFPLDTDVPYLRATEPLLMTVEGQTQELAQSTPVSIVDVQLTTTEAGIEILLDTDDGQLGV